jgi:hypothetical protein
MSEIACTTSTTGGELPCLNQGTYGDAIQHIQHVYGNDFTTPWWGESNSAHLKNAGYVIGFKKDSNPKIAWRLDYDETKGLHINFIDSTKDPTVKIYHKITVMTPLGRGRMATLPSMDKTPEANQHALWLAWTRALVHAKPPDQAHKGQIEAKLGYDWGTHIQVVEDTEHPWL